MHCASNGSALASAGRSVSEKPSHARVSSQLGTPRGVYGRDQSSMAARICHQYRRAKRSHPLPDPDRPTPPSAGSGRCRHSPGGTGRRRATRWCSPAASKPGRHAVDGEMLGFDPAARTLTFRSSATGPVVEAAVRALSPAHADRAVAAGAAARRRAGRARARGGAGTRLPAAVETAPPAADGPHCRPVETAEGCTCSRRSRKRPRCSACSCRARAYTRSEFGPSAEEVAASRWIASPTELLEAIERQQRMPILPLGQSLLALGLLTQRAARSRTGAADRQHAARRDAGRRRPDLARRSADRAGPQDGLPAGRSDALPGRPGARVAKLPHRIAVGFRIDAA